VKKAYPTISIDSSIAKPLDVDIPHWLGNTERALESQVGQHWPNPVSPELFSIGRLAVKRIFLQVNFGGRSRASLSCRADFGEGGRALAVRLGGGGIILASDGC